MKRTKMNEKEAVGGLLFKRLKLKLRHFYAKVLIFKKLAELPFDSNRKCMSVVIRETSGSGQESIFVFTKGAESAVLESSIDGPVEATKVAVDEFASAGLRTLVFAYKKITKEEFEDFAAKLAIAKFSIVNRFRFDPCNPVRKIRLHAMRFKTPDE